MKPNIQYIVIGLVIIIAVVAYFTYFAPLKGWDNYKKAEYAGNIGKEIQLHGTISSVYSMYGSSPFGGQEVGIFEYTLVGVGYDRAILDLSQISPVLHVPVNVTGIIRLAPGRYWDPLHYFKTYLEVTKIELG